MSTISIAFLVRVLDKHILYFFVAFLLSLFRHWLPFFCLPHPAPSTIATFKSNTSLESQRAVLCGMRFKLSPFCLLKILVDWEGRNRGNGNKKG